ncbi:TPA: recombinase family protein [Bacillus cereus]|uniref:recombinase family protein n=1 Tax=Bacillus cereus TaxID=1396 RepID=UPI001245DF04|nr:recombinase family protein [Bacillus cereus]BCC15183.1 hypothetical protein BCM0074_p303 [Bacillus cereus]HDR6306408.1 recombinase family protein [Bacillus cereus]
MKKAYAYYCGLSIGKTIETQQKMVRKYAKSNNIQIIEEFEEVVIPLNITKREELTKMLEKISSNKDIDYILVHSFEYITKDVMHMGYVMTALELDNGKTRIHSITEENDYDDPTKLMLLMIKIHG